MWVQGGLVNNPIEQSILQKLRALPPNRQAEVERFVDFLSSEDRGEAFESFLAVAESVVRARVPALTPEEIETELKQLSPPPPPRGLTAAELMERYRRLTTVVASAVLDPPVLANPDDDHVLACALAGKAEGDHLRRQWTAPARLVSGDPGIERGAVSSASAVALTRRQAGYGNFHRSNGKAGQGAVLP